MAEDAPYLVAGFVRGRSSVAALSNREIWVTILILKRAGSNQVDFDGLVNGIIVGPLR